MVSKYFGDKRPYRPSTERKDKNLADLRDDVEEAFVEVETDVTGIAGAFLPAVNTASLTPPGGLTDGHRVLIYGTAGAGFDALKSKNIATYTLATTTWSYTAPAAGMVVVAKDTGFIWTYNGTSWTAKAKSATDAALAGITVTMPNHSHAAGGATGPDGTGATGAGSNHDHTLPAATSAATTGMTATVVISRAMTVITNPAVASPNAVHANYADDQVNAFPGAFTNPDVPRNVTLTCGALWGGGDVTVVGTDQWGDPLTEVLADNPGGDTIGVSIFATVVSATKEIQAGAFGANASLGWGDKLGIVDAIAEGTLTAGVFCFANGTSEVAVWDTANEGFTPTTVPTGAVSYIPIVNMTSAVIINEGAGHAHNIGGSTGVESAHTHTGPSHTHTVPATANDATASCTVTEPGPGTGHTHNIGVA